MSDSTILVRGEGWKFKAAIGLGGLAVIVVLAFLYRLEVGLIVLAIGSAVGARVWVWAIHQHKLADFERRRLEAETRKIEAEAIKAKAHSFFVETNTGVFVLDGIAISQFYPAVQASKLLADAPPLLPPPEPPVKRLLDIEFIHLLVVGPSGSGKSTVLCHLIDNEPGNTAVVVLDPHSRFNIWPARADKVIGDGRNYEAIDQELVNLIAQMNRRYNGLESTSQRILVVCDEWLNIVDHCPNGTGFFNTIGSEARKVNMSLVLSSISSTVDDLAVSGAIRDNLSQLSLSPSLKAKNQALLRLSRKDRELVELPGRYRAYFIPDTRSHVPPPEVAGPVDPLPDLDAGPVPAVPTEKELRICELWDEGGWSQRAIYLEVYGKEPGGGRQLNEGVTEILRRFGRIE